MNFVSTRRLQYFFNKLLNLFAMQSDLQAVDDSAVHKTGEETITNIKTWSGNSIGPKVRNAAGTLIGSLVATSGNLGLYNNSKNAWIIRTTTGGIVVIPAGNYNLLCNPDGSLTWAGNDVTGDAHLAGAETFTGSKTFSAGLFGNAVVLSANDMDVTLGTVFTKTITANTTFSFSNVPASPVTACVSLILTNGGAYTITWPSSVKWNEGSAPDLSASGVDVLTFLTADGGTTWYGSVNLLGAA